MKKIVCFLLSLSALFVLVSCSAQAAAAESTVGSTQFDRVSQSYFAGDLTFDLDFYATGSDAALWCVDQIEYSFLKIGDVTVELSIDSVEVLDALRYGTYYKGHMVLSGELQPTSGEATLLVWFADEEDARSYTLGYISILSGAAESEEISWACCNGIVLQDEDGVVQTCGLFVCVKTTQTITITEIGMGLANVGLDTGRAVVFDSEEYHTTLEQALEDNTLEEYLDNPYQIATVDAVDAGADITLEAGEYYIYLPVVQLEGNDTALNLVTLQIGYVNADQDASVLVAGCFPMFGGNIQPESVLNRLFATG